ncbi:amidase [Erwinia sp. MMLR14_017]|uniref:amidase n=1 Tax=Erwinia sp. MMLR14_017 TaxID=3093842 RepID=UPI00298F6D92|nr:amidase [Erwinia sp. MMLR14_017]MDW8846471.1 amidase [Erwinia sp. MMLR14_017]
MKISEYTACDAVGLAKLIAKGEVSCDEVKSAALSAIGTVNPQLNAVVECWPDAPDSAQGEFRGVPMLVKDLGITVKGRKNELGSRLAAGNLSSHDSNLMIRLNQAGLVTLGRTATPELAASTTTEPLFGGVTRNPWNTAFSAGGSSGGSAAAVASGMVPAAHATDGGGSIRVPASATGLFGLKPSRGRISMGPDVDEVWSGLAVHGFVTRTVRDNAALLDAVQGNVAGDPFHISAPRQRYSSCVTESPGQLKIGVLTHPLNGKRTSPAIVASLEETVRHLLSQGHHVEEVVPDTGMSWDAFVEMNSCFWAANTAAWIDALAAGSDRQVNEETLEPSNLALWQLGHQLTAMDIMGAMHRRNIITQKMAAFYGKYDLLMTPTLADLPSRLGSYNQRQGCMDGREWMRHVFDSSPFTALANVCGTPAMSVPTGFCLRQNLPIGIQFFAGFGGESLLFRLAGELEQAFAWQKRKPPVWAGEEMTL